VTGKKNIEHTEKQIDMNRAIEAEIPILQRYALKLMRNHAAVEEISLPISTSTKSAASRERAVSPCRQCASRDLPPLDTRHWPSACLQAGAGVTARLSPVLVSAASMLTEINAAPKQALPLAF
jgi:hypothetical protein